MKKIHQPTISRFFEKKSVDCSSQPAKSLSNHSKQEFKENKDENETLFSTNNDLKRSFIQAECDLDENESIQTVRSAKRNKNTEKSPRGTLYTNYSLVAPMKKSPNIPSPPPQTEKYAFKGFIQSAVGETSSGGNKTAVEQNEQQDLHNEWVKKIGNARIKQHNLINENNQASKDDESEADDDEAPKLKKKGVKTGNLTPLEIQFLEIKKKHLDTILIVEVGYKFKFFGEDARIAAKELSIVCIPGKLRYDEHSSEAHFTRFASASIPVHRLPIHAKRLVEAGYKIGVVRQVETAALKKAGDNRNTPFTRKLTNLYTKGTYIDDVEDIDSQFDVPGSRASDTGYILCITESKLRPSGTDEIVNVGLIAVQPSTGDIVYDTFEDGLLRAEIETRFIHLAPHELLIVGNLTEATEKLVSNLSRNSTGKSSEQIRVERVCKEKTFAVTAHSHISQFYADKLKNQESEIQEREQNLLNKVLQFSEEVTICLSAMITYLSEYGLEHVFDLTKYFESFSARSHMLLNSNTLTSLEIYQNQTEYSDEGSLFWSLDKTQTRFGQRLLRKWVGRPLLDKSEIEGRSNAVEELKDGYQTPPVEKLKSLLRSIKPDLERSLIRIYYGKCTRPELLVTLETLLRLSNEYSNVKTPSDAGFKSTLINNAIATLPSIKKTVSSFISKICVESARKNDRYAFFNPDYENDLITDHKLGIAVVEQELDAHRNSASLILKKSKPLTYTTNAGIEYLLEIYNSDLKYVPASWTKVSGTKKISRFHTPEVIRMLRERDQHKESLTAACDAAFVDLLSQVSQYYVAFRDSISALATLDCIHSLSLVALQPGYTKPQISNTTTIDIIQGRHPMVEMLLPSTYIPNTTTLSTAPGHTRALCITGPNMGGKSSYVRHVALLVLMAQIGSYLPCESANIGIFDGIYTRMGAYDSIFTRQSTFHVELSETARILKCSTPRSLVILDELGRGTSTHDGVSIAESTLDWVVREKKCICLFITHYQSLTAIAKGFANDPALKNVHMKFESNFNSGLKNKFSLREDQAQDEEITFLYQVVEGVAYRSYGLNVARLAHVPKLVLEMAAKKSHELEINVKQKRLRALSKIMINIFKNENDKNFEHILEQLMIGIDELY